MKRTMPNERQRVALSALIGGDDNRRIRVDRWKGTSTIAIWDNKTDNLVAVLMLPTLRSLQGHGWITKASATDALAFHDITRAGREALAWYLVCRAGYEESRACLECFGENMMTAARTVGHAQLRAHLEKVIIDPDNSPANDDRIY